MMPLPVATAGVRQRTAACPCMLAHSADGFSSLSASKGWAPPLGSHARCQDHGRPCQQRCASVGEDAGEAESIDGNAADAGAERNGELECGRLQGTDALSKVRGHSRVPRRDRDVESAEGQPPDNEEL